MEGKALRGVLLHILIHASGSRKCHMDEGLHELVLLYCQCPNTRSEMLRASPGSENIFKHTIDLWVKTRAPSVTWFLKYGCLVELLISTRDQFHGS